MPSWVKNRILLCAILRVLLPDGFAYVLGLCIVLAGAILQRDLTCSVSTLVNVLPCSIRHDEERRNGYDSSHDEF